jgi:hypothetical protein
MTATRIENMTKEQLVAMVAALQAKGQRSLTCKVTAKKPDGSGTDGAISVYGLGRFPITLYAGQWERLAAEMQEVIIPFIAANEAIISRK